MVIQDDQSMLASIWYRSGTKHQFQWSREFAGTLTRCCIRPEENIWINYSSMITRLYIAWKLKGFSSNNIIKWCLVDAIQSLNLPCQTTPLDIPPDRWPYVRKEESKQKYLSSFTPEISPRLGRYYCPRELLEIWGTKVWMNGWMDDVSENVRHRICRYSILRL